jgi:hypothetical protein
MDREVRRKIVSLLPEIEPRSGGEELYNAYSFSALFSALDG